MECRCGYKGPAEVGDFGLNTKLLLQEHYRCPKCKGLRDKIRWLHSPDSIRKELMFPSLCHGPEKRHSPARRVVTFIIGGDNKTVGYSIHCLLCTWGESSSISIEDAMAIKKEFGDKINFVNAENELRKLLGR